MTIIQLLGSSYYIMYNKEIAKAYGVDEAILLGHLCSLSDKFGNEFFAEQQKICKETYLSEYRVRTATANLTKANVISVTKKGMPAKYYYRINVDTLLCTTSGAKSYTTGDIKNTIANNNTYNINNKENIIKETQTPTVTQISFDGEEISSAFITNNGKSVTNDKPKKKRGSKYSSLEEVFAEFELDDNLRKAVDLWLAYKKEKEHGEPYTPIGLRTTLKKIMANVSLNGVEHTVASIEESIARNYSGVYFTMVKPLQAARTTYIPHNKTEEEDYE